jgi:hypothetical protein
MKKAFFGIMALALVGLMSCASTPVAAPSAGPADTPPWLNDIAPEDALWGIGIAKQSTDSMSMTTAEARARVAVARQLSTKVQAMFTDYNLDAGPAGNQASTSLQEDVSRQITNIDVSGASVIKKWKAPDGTWWYLVQYKTSDAKAAVTSILGNQEAQYAQFKAKQALDILDAQLAKKEKPAQVDSN